MKRVSLSVAASALLGGALLLAADAAIVPNENLVAEGIPTIPASIAEAVRPYTEVRAAGFASWHPTRREMLITTRFADTNQVHRVAQPGGDRKQLTFFPERVAGASYQPTRGDYFVFVKDVGRGRVLPDLPGRCRDGDRDALDRREVAQPPRRLVASRGSHRVHVDPAQRRRYRHLRAESIRPEKRPARGAGAREEAGSPSPGRPMTDRSRSWRRSPSTKATSGFWIPRPGRRNS